MGMQVDTHVTQQRTQNGVQVTRTASAGSRTRVSGTHMRLNCFCCDGLRVAGSTSSHSCIGCTSCAQTSPAAKSCSSWPKSLDNKQEGSTTVWYTMKSSAAWFQVVVAMKLTAALMTASWCLNLMCCRCLTHCMLGRFRQQQALSNVAQTCQTHSGAALPVAATAANLAAAAPTAEVSTRHHKTCHTAPAHTSVPHRDRLQLVPRCMRGSRAALVSGLGSLSCESLCRHKVGMDSLHT